MAVPVRPGNNPNQFKKGNNAKYGRPAGSLNKNTLESKKIIEEALKSGISPLQYMLNIMRDKKADKARRDDMAKAAAPYLHPRLQAIEHSGTINNSAADPHELDDTELEVIARAGRSGAVAAAPGTDKLN